MSPAEPGKSNPMREFFMGVIAAAVVGGAFLVGREQAPPPAPARFETPREPGGVQPDGFDPGTGATLSVYNPDGRLLKYYQVEGRVEVRPLGYVVFQSADGKVVRTNGTFILEGTSPLSRTP